MPTSTCFLRVVWRFAMSIAPSASPFHTDDEPIRNHGSTASSFGRRAVALRPDDLRAGDLDVVERDRARLVPAEAEGVPQRGLRLAVLLVDHEDREVVVALELGAGGLDDVEVGEAARRRPRRLLRDAVAAVRALRLRRDRVPEVRSRLGVGVRQRPDQPVLSGRMYLSTSSVVGRSMIACTAPTCIT